MRRSNDPATRGDFRRPQSRHDPAADPSLAEELDRLSRDGTMRSLYAEAWEVVRFHADVPAIPHRPIAWATVRRVCDDRLVTLKLSVEVQRRPG